VRAPVEALASASAAAPVAHADETGWRHQNERAWLVGGRDRGWHLVRRAVVGLRGRILSVVATLRQPGRNVLGYLVEACQARLFGETAPSLLPAPVAQPPDQVPKG
jgi:hypothetical protein